VYVDGHGIHLSANDVGHYNGIAGRAEEVRHFWDERFGHIEWHLGFLGLLAALALADKRRGRLDRVEWVAALLLGWTFFTNTVEGQDWWLTLGAAVVFGAWSLVRPARALAASAVATVGGAALIGAWAAWHGGVPQFSDVGWL
jgi:putative copper export protein